MTHGHEQWCGDCLREWGVLGAGGEKGENWDNCNSIINQILFKKKRSMHAYVHCSVIYNSQHKETTKVCMDGWAGEEIVVHVLWNISRKRRETLPFATTMWMDLEGISLSEISQRKTNTI